MSGSSRGTGSDDHREARIEDLLEEFLERQRRGEWPTVEEYAAKEPDLAERIRRLFPALVALERARPGDSDMTSSSGPSVADPRERAGKRIGEYRILREIGRGGMGVVYEAEQESLGRHVALKVLPFHHFQDPRRVERFRREARAAARLQHPHIVPIHDFGEIDGLPYYAMQYIAGQGLDQVIGELRRMWQQGAPSEAGAMTLSTLSLVEENTGGASSIDVASTPAAPTGDVAVPEEAASRAGLPGHSSLGPGRARYFRAVGAMGRQVAEALFAAHMQGILHRDIKPSNLLLDARGNVWVTDFGLAKAAESEDVTLSGEIVGTLRYMAPESFRGWSDPRSDIYGLGVTLYELLALRPAFEENDRERLRKQVLEDDPSRLRRIDPLVPRDLEMMVLKAMAKEPGHRYADAGEMAADLGRWLAGEPILARPVSTLERGLKWARRKPWQAAVIAVSFLSLVGLVGGVLWHSARLGASVEATRLQRVKAERNLERARRAVDTMLTEVAEGPLAMTPGMEPVRKRLLEEALKLYLGFLEEREDDKSVRDETGRSFGRLGYIEYLLGQHDRAEEHYKRSLEVFRRLLGEFPVNPEFQKDLVHTCQYLEMLYMRRGRLQEAEEVNREALARSETLAARHNMDPLARRYLAAAYGNQGKILYETGRHDEGLKAYEKAIALNQELVEADPNPEHRFDLARAQGNLALCLGDKGETRESSLKLFPVGIAICQKLVEEVPGSAPYRKQLGLIQQQFGSVLYKANRVHEACEAYEGSRTTLEKLSAMHPENLEYRRLLLRTQAGLGALFRKRGETRRAEEALRAGMDVGRGLVKEFQGDLLLENALADVLHNLGVLLFEKGEASEGLKLEEEALNVHRKAFRSSPRNPAFIRTLFSTSLRVSQDLLKTGDHQAAARFADEMVSDSPDEFGAYNAACTLARCVPLVEKDPKLDADARRSTTQSYADRAMDHLRGSVQKGFRDVKQLSSDNDLDPLRDREDFKTLQSEVEATAKAAAPPAAASPSSGPEPAAIEPVKQPPVPVPAAKTTRSR